MKFFILFLFTVIGVVCSAHLGRIPSKRQNANGRGLGIVNGKPVDISKYPYMSSISVDYMLTTAGIVVDKHWILSSAIDALAYIKFFVPFVGSNQREKGQQLSIEKIVIHPKFEGNWDYNAALLKLTEPIQFSKKVKKIAIATEDLPAGTVGATAGWGTTQELTAHYSDYSDVLRAANNTVLDDASCKKAYGSWYSNKTFCLKVEATGPCSGDMGGPFVVNKKLYGMFSGFLDDCTANPRVYVKMSTIADWIKKTIKGH